MERIVVGLVINLFHSVFALLYSPDNFAEKLLKRKANDSCQKIIWYGGWYTYSVVNQKTFTTHLDCGETKMATTFQGA